MLFYQSGRRSRHPRVPSTGKASTLSCEFLLFCALTLEALGKFDTGSFSEYLQGRSSALGGLLKASYRGFLIVRPLPRSIIGRTCLVNYDKDGGRRHFPTGIPCEANLFGLPLSITTVPFQEQDTVTAACARVLCGPLSR